MRLNIIRITYILLYLIFIILRLLERTLSLIELEWLSERKFGYKLNIKISIG